MVDYETIALAVLGLSYLARNIYLNKKRAGTIRVFDEFVDNYMPQKTKEIGCSFNEVINKLEKLAKTKKN